MDVQALPTATLHLGADLDPPGCRMCVYVPHHLPPVHFNSRNKSLYYFWRELVNIFSTPNIISAVQETGSQIT